MPDYFWGEERAPLSKETKKKISTSKLGNRNRWRPELDKLYEEAKKLVENNVSVVCACEAVGITKDQYYRRRRIELTGKDRKQK
jgi:hypothetical protein